MQTICKYKLEVDNKQEIKIPLNSEVLCVQTQFDAPYIWVLIPDANEEKREVVSILTFGTGNRIVDNIDNYDFLGTYQLMAGSLIFHVFYKYTNNLRIHLK